jgi:hypothetical protein
MDRTLDRIMGMDVNTAIPTIPVTVVGTVPKWVVGGYVEWGTRRCRLDGENSGLGGARFLCFSVEERVQLGQLEPNGVERLLDLWLP